MIGNLGQELSVFSFESRCFDQMLLNLLGIRTTLLGASPVSFEGKLYPFRGGWPVAWWAMPKSTHTVPFRQLPRPT